MKIRIKTKSETIVGELISDDGKINVELEREVGDDIVEVLTLKGLCLTLKQLLPCCDSWTQKFKNKRERV